MQSLVPAWAASSQPAGAGSLLLPLGPEESAQSLGFGNRHFYPLSHLGHSSYYHYFFKMATPLYILFVVLISSFRLLSNVFGLYSFSPYSFQICLLLLCS